MPAGKALGEDISLTLPTSGSPRHTLASGSGNPVQSRTPSSHSGSPPCLCSNFPLLKRTPVTLDLAPILTHHDRILTNYICKGTISKERRSEVLGVHEWGRGHPSTQYTELQSSHLKNGDNNNTNFVVVFRSLKRLKYLERHLVHNKNYKCWWWLLKASLARVTGSKHSSLTQDHSPWDC